MQAIREGLKITTLTLKLSQFVFQKNLRILQNRFSLNVLQLFRSVYLVLDQFGLNKILFDAPNIWFFSDFNVSLPVNPLK